MNKNVKPCSLALLLLAASVFTLCAGETDLNLLGGAKWTFYPGFEFPGAKGASRVESVDGRNALVLAYDFTGGGAYVAANAAAEIPEGTKEVLVDVKADRELKIMVRLEDSTKQTHQYQLLYETGGAWQTLKVDLSAPPKGSFGGAKDGAIHYPITKLWLGVGKGKTTADPGEAAFSAVKISQ